MLGSVGDELPPASTPVAWHSLRVKGDVRSRVLVEMTRTTPPPLADRGRRYVIKGRRPPDVRMDRVPHRSGEHVSEAPAGSRLAVAAGRTLPRVTKPTRRTAIRKASSRRRLTAPWSRFRTRSWAERGPLAGGRAPPCCFGLIVLWPERADVWYLNDASVHRSMVGWAADRIRDGHMPFDGWYPYLSLGASRFHHYQSLPHILTGPSRWSAATPPSAGRSTSCWRSGRSSVYAGGRLLGLGRWPAAAAALISPLLSSVSGARLRVGELRLEGLGHVGPALGDVGAPVRVGSVLAGGRQGQTTVAGCPGARVHDLPAPADRLPRAVLRRRCSSSWRPGRSCDGSGEPPSWWAARCSPRRGCSCRCSPTPAGP